MAVPLAPLALLLLALQQPGIGRSATSTPPSRDTTGYWQQDIAYQVVATLDETRAVLSARAELRYTNHSPDTLRDFYVHQYLNAFRPGSQWSAVDEREGRERYQHLGEPDYGYERFTATPEFDGVAVRPDYPGAPDSTVAHFRLPASLPPGGTVRVTFQWDARPSTLPRRQGRRGRSFDFAQWYPKVAVYDRGGWEPNALVPAGEFYGEYGTYDVTVVLREDQVVAGTGIVVDGDPGWQRVLRAGAVHDDSRAYGTIPTGPAVTIPAGFRSVRFVARDVHEFAWSTSPDYRYEGAVFVHPSTTPVGFRVYDTVGVHVLYRPGDDATWANGLGTNRVLAVLRSLEGIYGPYGYPEFTALHRIEGGGTEFPMMVMAEAPAFLPHETAHQFAMAVLGNNEWRSAWMDEGLTGYLGGVIAGNTAQDRRAPPAAAAAPRPGYRGLAIRPDPAQASQISQQRLVHVGLAEPPGTPSSELRDYNIYNTVIYTPMYGALRESLGDSLFRAFLRDYYTRWAFKHVDEDAMRGSAERVSGRDLGWFFQQWIHEVGNVDYALTTVETRREGDAWVTRARVVRRGGFRHPMPVGVRVGTTWVIGRADPLRDTQWVEIRTAARPEQVILDPLRVTMDWDRRNDVPPLRRIGATEFVRDWPFLEQGASDRTIAALSPIALVSGAGGVAVGMRARVNYQGTLSRIDKGIALSVGAGARAARLGDAGRWASIWAVVENPRLPFSGAPQMGMRLAAWYVDDAVRLDASKRWDVSRYTTGTLATRTLSLTWLQTHGLQYLSPVRWDDGSMVEASLIEERRLVRPDSLRAKVMVTGGMTDPRVGSRDSYGRLEIEGSARRVVSGGATAIGVRGFVGLVSTRAPHERRVYVASGDPVETFANHWLRPMGGLLARDGVHYVALGDGALRGYARDLTLDNLGALNVDASRRVHVFGAAPRPPALWVSVFTDGGVYATRAGGGTRSVHWLGDAGIGLTLRGLVYDREVRVRLDAPLYVQDPGLATGARSGDGSTRFRWTFSTTDLW